MRYYATLPSLYTQEEKSSPANLLAVTAARFHCSYLPASEARQGPDSKTLSSFETCWLWRVAPLLLLHNLSKAVFETI